MVINGVTIEDEKSFAAAKEKFRLCRSRWGKRGKLDFDEILDRLIRGDSWSSIAEAHGVSRQMMSKHICPYFRDWLPGIQEGGLKRRRTCAIKRVEAKAREVLNKGVLMFVIQEAKRLGYNAKPVQRNSAQQAEKEQPLFHRNQVTLQGQLCFLHHLTLTIPSIKGTKREGGQLRFPLDSKSIKFRIVVTDFPNRPRRMFAFPAEILPGSGALYIPADKTNEPYHNHHSTIDVWKYEGDDALHQFDQFIKT